MRFFYLAFIAFFSVPVTVLACEGDCIVGITNAVLGNYTDPIQNVMLQLANEISEIIPGNPDATTCLDPIMVAFREQSYSGMETAIFPGYFHGKCQQNGVEPAGCPDPDCPVVCGTSGSIVHFFPKFRYIAFNEMRQMIKTYSMPGSDSYNQVEQRVIDAANSSGNERRWSVYGRWTSSRLTRRSTDDLKAKLKVIMGQVGTLFLEQCGGNDNGETNGLPDCSWEAAMKDYILSFP